MNILVIGGNGFIGSHLVDHLIKKQHNVRVFDNVYERYREPLKKVDYRISNLDNIPDLYEALLNIDIIFHLATKSVPSTSNIDTSEDVKNNLIPTLNILNLSLKLGIKRIVYFSSGGAIYGNTLKSRINEEHKIDPISSYGIVKATTEMYLSLYQRMYNLEPLILRPSNCYGPRQGHFIAQGVISTFLRKIKMNDMIMVYGDGNSKKDYIFITDLIHLAYELCFRNKVGVFNLGSGIGITINQIIDQIKNTTGRNFTLKNMDNQIYDVNHFVLDITKTTKIFGDLPSISLEEGISRTWDWLNSLK